MASKTDLTETALPTSSERPFLTGLDTTINSIVAYINDEVKDNLVQVTNDAFPSGIYAFTDDGAAALSNGTLWDPQTSQGSYTGGNFTISTTGAWTDIDATNVKITVTPDKAGNWIVDFGFSVEMVTSNATNECDVRFRITDGSTASTFTPRIHSVSGVTATTLTVPVHLQHIYTSAAASSTTYKIQYYITTLTATTLKVLAVANDPIVFNARKQ